MDCDSHILLMIHVRVFSVLLSEEIIKTKQSHLMCVQLQFI